MSKVLIYSMAAAALLGVANAECPNACSGHGTCGANDMCSCYRNWQTSDCSERTCPYGWSFTTTPQGDLNMDGDRFDSSLKPIVYKVDSGSVKSGEPILASINQLTDQLVFNGNVDSSELTTGDCLKIVYKSIASGVTTATPKYFCISAVSATAPLTTFTLDADNDEAADIVNAVVYKWLEDIPNPAGTWESWPGQATTQWHDDGHFYMECSNAGACSRADGTCVCFQGYTGIACSRTACPSDCSGHGTCMSVKELAVAAPNKLAQTVTVTTASKWVGTDTSVIGTLAPGDRVFLGEQATFDASNLYIVEGVRTNGFYIDVPARTSAAFGSTLYHAANYGLWDADKNQGCNCDPGFTGHACERAVCPHGADPLDARGEDYNQSTSTASISSFFDREEETQTLYIDSSCGTVTGTFALIHTDQVTGEKITTEAIEAMPRLSSTVTVSEPAGTDAKYCNGDVTTVHGSDLNAPTAAHRLIGEVSTSGAKLTYLLAEVTTKGPLAGCIKKIAFEPHLPTYELSVGDFVRVGDEYREIGALNQDTTSGNYSWGYVTERFNSQYAAGTPAFRKNAEQVIESALTNLANGAIMSASASKLVAGTQLKATFDVHTSKHHGTYFALNNWNHEFNPTVVDNVCVGDLIATNNYDLAAVGLTVGAQQYLRQVLKTETTAASAVLDEGAGGANGASRLVVGAHNSFHKGHIEETTANAVADIMPGVQNGVAPENTLFRSSGGMYEIKTDVDGDPTEFVCDNSGLRTSYIASSAGYVSRNEPQTVRFVDASYGSAQPALKPLAVFGGTPAGSPSALTKGSIIFVGSNKCTVTSVFGRGGVSNDDHAQSAGSEDTNAVMGDEISGVTCAETLTADAHSTADAIANNEPVEIQIGGATTSCFATDMRAIRFQSGNPSDESTVKISSVSGGNRKVTHTTAANPLVDHSEISVGDRVMLKIRSGLYETRTIDSVNTDYKSFTVSKAFSASVSTADTYKMWVVGKGSKSHTECSGRGLCDDSAGQCACFKGYTKQACSEQSALAA
jgi:hypothetical protein